MRRKLRFESLERRNMLSWSAWIGGSSANWNNPADWANQGGTVGVPTAASDVYIEPQTAQTITIPAGSNLSVNSITLGSNATLALPAVDPTNPSSNGLSNAGFESPAASVTTTTATAPGGPWYSWGNAYLSTQSAFAGSQSLVVSGSNSGVGQTVAATPGASYTASVYAMTPSSNPLSGSIVGELNLLFYSGSTLLSTYAAPNQDVLLNSSSSSGGSLTGSVGSSGWTHYYTTAIAPAGTTSVAIGLATYASSSTYGGVVYFDNAALGLSSSGATNPATNLLGNAGFETPTASSTTTTTTSTSTPPGASWYTWGSAYLSTQFAYAGTQSLVVSGSNSGAGQSIAASPGVSYTASVYAMTPAGNALSGSIVGELTLLFYSGSTLLSSYVAPNQDVILSSSSASGGSLTGSVGSSGWSHYYTTAIAPAGTTSLSIGLSTYASTSTFGGVVYFDNAAVGPTPLSPPALVSGAITNAGTLLVGTGASLTENGAFSNAGTLLIGAGATVTVNGTYTQASTGLLDIQLGGSTDSGTLTINSYASFGGTFEIDIVDGYQPSTTDSFTPLTFNYSTSAFSNYTMPESLVPAGNNYQFFAALSFTNMLVSAAPITPVSTTIYAGADVLPLSPNLNGVNVTYYDTSLQTSQTQQMITAAGVGLLRFPGGSASDYIHFNLSANLNDASAITIPQFGEDVANASANGLVTVDYGSGSPQEAAAELAYLEGSPTDTTPIGTGIEWLYGATGWTSVNWGTVGYWASLRAASPLTVDDGLNFLRIDHPAPFSTIKYWEIGNEEYASWETDHHGTAGPGGVSTGAQHDPATYVAFMKTFQSLASEITTKAGLSAILIGVDTYDPTGASDNNWTKNVLTVGLADGFVPGFLSDHMYIQAPGSESDSYLLNDTVTDPASYFDWSTKHALYETLLQQTLGAQASSVQLMATEYGSVYGSPGKQSTSLVQGLYVAESIGSLMESGYSASAIWNLHDGWELGNNDNNALYGWRQGGDFGVLGSTSQTTAPATGAYIGYPSYYAMQLASKIILPGAETVAFGNSYSDLNVYPVVESNGNLEMLVVNTNPAAPITDEINLNGFSPVKSVLSWQYGKAEDAAQAQSATGASALTFASLTGGLSGSTFTYTFPSYSLTVLIFQKTPAVVTPATALPSAALVGTPVVLSVLGGDLAGESNVTYTWTTVGTPPAPVAYSANGTNAAKNTTVTLTAPGTYTFLVTITDSQGYSVTSSVVVTVTSAVGNSVKTTV